MTPDQFAGLLAAAGLGGGNGDGVAVPKRMAEVNAMLAVAAPELRERLLVEFLNAMYVPNPA